jgi:hypothetical protein
MARLAWVRSPRLAGLERRRMGLGNHRGLSYRKLAVFRASDPGRFGRLSVRI